MLCVENLYVEVNMYVKLWSYTLTQVTQCTNKWWGAEWLRQRHYSPCYQDTVPSTWFWIIILSYFKLILSYTTLLLSYYLLLDNVALNKKKHWLDRNILLFQYKMLTFYVLPLNSASTGSI